MADPPGFAVSAHGGRASVNIPQCRGVDFIGVVTTVGATRRNLRTPITCQIYIVISLLSFLTMLYASSSLNVQVIPGFAGRFGVAMAVEGRVRTPIMALSTEYCHGIRDFQIETLFGAGQATVPQIASGSPVETPIF